MNAIIFIPFWLVSIFSSWLLTPGDTIHENKTIGAAADLGFGKRIVQIPGTAASTCFIGCDEIYHEGLDTVSRTIFWRRLMRTGKDSVLFYTQPNRRVLAAKATEEWKAIPEMERLAFLNRLSLQLQSEEVKVSYMFGRSHFYDVKGVIPQIDRAVKIFEENNTDPFFAQAILLIESPAKLAKSSVGAYGPFQLMKSVGKQFGLKINNKVDERADFDKSAVAASKLINRVCVPYTNRMLEKRNIAWCPTDLWYRLLVLHVYHAGAGNVAKALNKIEPTVGNTDLIKTLWTTNAGGFQNASQNYSQVAIASLLELHYHLNYIPSTTSLNVD